MKKITLSVVTLFLFQIGNSQVLNQPANWPNTNWTTSGTFAEAGLLFDPTSADSFTFDDDAAGSTSYDDINSESPVIDLTAASAASENLILISGDYYHYDIGGSLSVDYWNYDTDTWVALLELESTGFTASDYQNCINQVYFESELNISGFSATQLSNFKYRISYDDADGWQWGWCIKNVSIVSETPPSCYVPAITSWNMTIDGLIVDGTNQEGIVNYQLEYSETTFTPGDGTATVYEFDSFPHTLTGLAEGTTYYFAMQSNCGDSVSDWIGSPDEWTTEFVGSTAYAPIVIESIPYATSDDTINYGDDYTNPPLGCGSGIGYYLNGDDVVYLYTAASTMSLDVNLAPSIGEGGTSANYAGMYVYENAEDVGVNCWIAELELGFSSEPASFELSVTEGSTYYFVISTWAAPQNVAYDLSITELLCGTPTNLTVSNVTSAGADVSWDVADAVSWEYVSSTSEDSSIPTEAGESLSEPNVSIVDLNPISAYTVWVRAICEDGSVSDWTSVSFNTLLQSPECGESISQYDYPNASSGGSIFDDNFDIANDYSADLLFSTTAGDQDGDGNVDEVTVTISGSTETGYDWVFITNGAGELLYGPASGTQDAMVTSTDGTINVYLAADGSLMGGPITFDVSCAGLSVNDFDLSDLKLYPNPGNGDYVTIQSSVSGEKNIEVYDVTGKRLINTILNSDKLDISSVSSGVYLVKVTIQGQTKVSKLVIR